MPSYTEETERRMRPRRRALDKMRAKDDRVTRFVDRLITLLAVGVAITAILTFI